MFNLNVLRNSFKTIIKSESFLGSAILSITNALMSVIAFLATIIAVKFYSPAEFGIISLVVGLSSILCPIGVLCLDLAVYRVKEEKDLSRIFTIALFIFVSATIFAVIAFKTASYFTIWNQNYQLAFNYYYLIAAYVSLSGLSRLFYSLNFIKMHHKRAAFARVAETFAHHGGMIILGYLGYSIFGGCLASVLGVMAGILILYFGIPKYIKSFNFNKSKNIISENIHFISFTIPTVFLKNLNFSLPMLIFASLYNAKTLGLILLALRILRVPHLTFNQISQVILSKLKEMHNAGNIRNYYLTMVVITIGLGLAVIPLVNLFPESIFSIFFNPEWVECLAYIKAILPWIFFETFFVLFTPFYIKFNFYKILLVIEFITTLVLTIVTLSLYTNGYDILGTIKIINFVLAATYASFIFLPILFIKKKS